LVLGGAQASRERQRPEDLPSAEAAVRAALTSGRGLDKLVAIIEEQGGDPRVVDDPTRLPAAPNRTIVRSEHSGYVVDIHAELVGHATMILGAGRDRVEDAIDPAVGAVIQAQRGQRVRPGD